MEGFYDDYTYEEWSSDSDMLTDIQKQRRNEIAQSNNKYIYQFMMTPTAGFLNENKVY